MAGTGAAGTKGAAQQSHEQSQVAPATAPSATQSCPNMMKLELGCFFDGTGNNMFDSSLADTNVVRLFRLYSDQPDSKATPPLVRQKNYLKGVGSGDATAPDQPTRTLGNKSWWGGATGFGMKERCQMMYAWVKTKAQAHSDKFTNESLKVVDIYGFSRGSAQARTFANLVVQAFKKEAEKDPRLKNITVRFLGIFDTVLSEHGGVIQDQNLGINNGDCPAVRHFTARDEVRKNFPLTALRPAGEESQYAGVHSDVGGGYGADDPSRADAPDATHSMTGVADVRRTDKKTNELAYVTLMDMYNASHDVGIVFLKDVNGAVAPFSVSDLEALKTLANTKEVEDPTTQQGKDFRQKYVHQSATNENSRTIDWGVLNADNLSNAPEKSGKRTILTAVVRTLESIPPEFSWSGAEPE